MSVRHHRPQPDHGDAPDGPAAPRPIHTAELLAVGTELTVGETTDTNSGELARSLTAHGAAVARIHDLPDDLAVVTGAIREALTRVDLVVMTGGLGPTPDDLTRESVAAACGEDVTVDPDTLSWLEGLWARRGLPFPGVNTKQAWVIPSSTILPNPNGTAPGWWVDRPDGRVIVTLPGPPREMRPMWADHVLPRLAARGLGADTEVRTLRLTGIGESQVADVLGEPLLRATNPIVATYARVEAVDVRISARTAGGRRAVELVDEAEAAVLAHLAPYVWAHGSTTWSQAIAAELTARGWTLATDEAGTDGALVTLLGAMDARVHSEVHRVDGPGDASGASAAVAAMQLRDRAGADVALVMRVLPRGEDLVVHVGVATPSGADAVERPAFLRGTIGRDRAALAAAAVLLERLRANSAS